MNPTILRNCPSRPARYWTARCLSIVLAAALLLLGGCAGTASQAGGDSSSKTADSASNGIVRARLDNGLRVVIVRNQLAPAATTVMTYRVGANETPPGFPGTAHALEHMMFRGSPGLSSAQLSSISAAMGADFNAVTRQTATQYFFTVPADYLDVALRIQSIRMRGILTTPELWQKERGAIEQEVAQDLSNPQYIFYRKLIAQMFAGTPYAHDGLGTRESFNKTTAEDLHRFYRDWYAPNNATLVIVGDIDPQKTLEQVRERFHDIPSKPLPPRPPVNLKPVQPTHIDLKTDQPYGVAVLAFRMPGYHSPDYPAAEVLAQVLDSQRGDLYALVPQGKALSANFAYDTLPDSGIGYAIGAFPDGGDGGKLIDRMRETLQQRLKEGISPALVKAAKRSAITQAESQKNSISGLAMTWAYALTVQDLNSPQDEIDAIQKVTVDDVNRVARQYLDFGHTVTAVLTPQSSGEAVSSSGGFGGKESFAPEHVENVKLPSWAAAALQKLTVPKSAINPTVTTLDNGLRVIVQPAHTSDTVSVYGHIRNQPAMTVPEGKEGVDQVLDQLFSYGTRKLDRLEFQRALDEIGAQESAGEDFYLMVLNQHFERGVELLASNEREPALPESAFKVVRSQTASETAGRLKSPDFHFRQALHKALYPKNDPTLRHATPESVSSLSLADVKAYYDKVFRPDLTTIVVIGNIDPQRAINVIREHFGDWHATGTPPPTTLPPVPPNRMATIAVPDQTRVQDRVILAQTLGITRTSPDYYALKLGNEVLSGGFYASRLYQALRERTGLVYYVGSRIDAERSRAHLAISYASDPDKVNRAQAIIRRNLERMRSTPIGNDELYRARAQLVRAIPLSEASQHRIASGLIYRASHNLPLDEPVRAARKYIALTPKDIMQAFRQWVRPDDLVRVSQGPAPQ